MLAEHRDVVSIHEFFTGLDWGRRFAGGDVSGPELATLIAAEQPVTTAVLSRGHTSDEIQYPFDAPNTRFSRSDPTPWLLVTMLSRLTDEPDAWFDDMIRMATARPSGPMSDHYRALFRWATTRAGGSLWIERSGSSLDYLGELASLYPRARFVHIHRDGHEAALSIRTHPFFRLAVTLVMGLFPVTSDEEAAVTEVIETPPPCWAVGRYWSDQVLRGFAALPLLDRDQFLQVRFEDLVGDPTPVLEEIAAFFDLPEDPDYLPRGAALVGAPPAARFGELTVTEQDELRDACRPGQVLLGRAE
jgi:putative sulfotransferase